MNEINPSLFPKCVSLEPTFFEQETVLVAKKLLGSLLWKFMPDLQCWQPFTIVETEAYTQEDPACHAYNKTSGRAEILYKEAGTAYVYLIYGMYDCLNVVTEKAGTAGAVLFRALEPPPGTFYKTNGPGRLTKSLGITRAQFNGINLTKASHGLFLSEGDFIPDSEIITTTRIGITKAAEYPWRFYIRNNPWVSVKAKDQQHSPQTKRATRNG